MYLKDVNQIFFSFSSTVALTDYDKYIYPVAVIWGASLFIMPANNFLISAIAFPGLRPYE